MTMMENNQEAIKPFTVDVDDISIETSGGNVKQQIVGQSEPTSEQRMRLVELSGTLDFWDRPEEDVYSLEDGEPI